MSKWPMVRLGDVATVVSGTTPSTTVAEYWDGEYNWVTPAEINDGTIVVDKTQRKITALAIANCGLKSFPAGTVLLSSRAPIGKVAIAGTEMFCNQGFKNLICGELIYNKYLFWYLKYKKDYLNSLGRGATFKEISKTIVENVQVPLPPLEVQKKIAQTLDAAAELIALRKKQLAELDNLVKAVFYDMFGDPVVNDKGWNIFKLSDICAKITDGTHNSPDNFADGEYMYITAKNIKKYGIDIRDITYVSEEVHRSIYSRCDPEYGDILYIKDGVTTGIAQINTLRAPFSMLSSVALLKHKRNLVSNYYLREVLNNDNMYNSIRNNMGGAAITRLTLVKIINITIPLPPIDLQNQFAAIVTKIEEQKALVQKAIDESQYLFDSLMGEYFG